MDDGHNSVHITYLGATHPKPKKRQTFTKRNTRCIKDGTLRAFHKWERR